MKILLTILKTLWRGLCFVRDLVMNIVFLLFVLLCLSVFGLFLQSSPSTAIKEGALLLNLDGYLADNRPQDNLFNVLRELDDRQIPQQISTFDVVQSINYAAVDERIKGIVLDLNYFSGGDMPSLQFIGKALKQFKQNNKPVYAIGRSYSQAQYLLASYADHIYLNSHGEVGLTGLAQNNLYFKSLIEKLEITPHIFRVGTYKAAVEPFMRNDMSPEAKDNTRLWLNQMWQNYQQTIAENRKITPSAVLPQAKQFLEKLKAVQGNSAEYALQQSLVDELKSDWEIQNELAATFGYNETEQQYNQVSMSDYLTLIGDRTYSDAAAKIAVVNVEGEIVDGISDDNAGSDTIVAQLQAVLNDRAVRALILRINSPGGSAFASEVIRQQLQQLKLQGIPIVVSMGGMAASGGYWIAADADYIVAAPNTITGSIGIFAALFTLENTLKQGGIYSDGVNTSPLSRLSLTQSLPDELNQAIQMNIEHGYEQFLTLVANGRDLNKAQVDAVAQGQVWLGEHAAAKHLVDELGDFDVAVNAALKLVNANLTEAETPFDFLPTQWFVDESQDMISRLFSHGRASIQSAVFNAFGLPQQPFKQLKNRLGVLKQLNDPRGQYLYCLDCSVSY
ncbi:signal peptide peptidase SppA [Chelonobacter oris]|uniref:signal peptide peptidase SppA n=1 Tax=Chelonobacter oris TaxID=505317 RepID=UPI0024493A38|nr:signal peptide peptidase SppA [Chelonobacter oris]MDH2999387.1 signal peptide peptidase SppA [Chelonobacter oris]